MSKRNSIEITKTKERDDLDYFNINNNNTIINNNTINNTTNNNNINSSKIGLP